MRLMQANSFANVRADIKNLSVLEVDPKSITKFGYDLSHKGVPLGHQAFIDLCNTFSLQYTVLGPEQRSTEWDTKHPHAWRDLSRSLADFKGKTGLLGVLDSSDKSPSIIRILGRAEPSPDSLNFLSTGVDCAEALIAQQKKLGKPLDVMGLYVDRKELLLRFAVTSPDKEYMPIKDDSYNPGYCTEFGQKQTILRPALLRLVCTNGMTVMTRISLRRVSAQDPKTFLKSVTRVDPFGDVEKFLKHGVIRMTQHTASVHEAVQVGAILNDPEGGKYLVDINRIQDAYADPDLLDYPQAYLKYANSGIRAYDLFNLMTDHASHDKSLGDADRNQLNLMASRMLVDGPTRSVVPPDPFSGKRRK